MAIRPLTESFEVSGEWYLPEHPERQIAGRLHYTSERSELHLEEAFRPLPSAICSGDSPQVYPIINGTSIKGEAITLFNAQRLGISLHINQGRTTQSEKLISSCCLLGAHLSVDFAYTEISFRVPALQIWLSREIFEESLNQDPSTDRVSLSYRTLQIDPDITQISSIDATLKWSIVLKTNSDAFTSISVRASAWIIIKPTSPQVLEWYFQQQSKLAAMLAFLAGTPMSPDCIEACIGHGYHHKVSVMASIRDARYSTFKYPHDFFMLRSEMETDLAIVVANWFEIYPKLHMPSQLAVSIFASEKLWLHVEFISLMQALEGLHRSLYDGTYMDETDYEQIKQVLADAIPAELSSNHKDALRSRIRYGNQVSLRKRLDALAGTLCEPIRKLVIGRDGTIPRSWIDTRHYYTHWDEELRSNVLDGRAMHSANIRMRNFVRVLYLQLMGIPQEAILRSLGNSSGISQRLTQLNALERRLIDPKDTSGVIMTLMEQREAEPHESI